MRIFGRDKGGTGVPAARDFPSDPTQHVGHNPQVYSSMFAEAREGTLRLCQSESPTPRLVRPPEAGKPLENLSALGGLWRIGR